MGNYISGGGVSGENAAAPDHRGDVDSGASGGSRRRHHQLFHASLDEIDLTTNSRSPRKRKKGSSTQDASPDGSGASKMNTPTRKKLKSTSRYIYETLFENGQDSDVTIQAMGRSWKLHKVYLCQSAYFNSMFR